MTTKVPDVTILAKLSSDTMLTLAPEVVDKAGKFSSADSVVGRVHLCSSP